MIRYHTANFQHGVRAVVLKFFLSCPHPLPVMESVHAPPPGAGAGARARTGNRAGAGLQSWGCGLGREWDPCPGAQLHPEAKAKAGGAGGTRAELGSTVGLGGASSLPPVEAGLYPTMPPPKHSFVLPGGGTPQFEDHCVRENFQHYSGPCSLHLYLRS